MKNIYIVLNENTEKFVFYLFYYFRDFDFRVLDLNMLMNATDKRDIIYFGKNYHPFRGQIETLKNLETEDKFMYLSSDKNIYYISKDNYKFTDNYLDISKTDKTLEIFDNTTEYNHFDHEPIIDKKDYTIVDYHYLCKLFSVGKLESLFNKNISIRLINDYMKQKYGNKKIYNQIHIITDQNIDNYLNFKTLDNTRTHYTLFFMMKKQNYENEMKIKYLVSKLKEQNVLYSVYPIKKIYQMTHILEDKLLYFENLVFSTNFDIQLDICDRYMEHYNYVVTDNLIISPAETLLKLHIRPHNDDITKEDLINLLKSYIINLNTNLINLNTKLYCPKQIKDKYASDRKIKDNFTALENMLFTIKDYEKLLDVLDNHLKNTYLANETGVLIVKKITIAILTQKENVLNEQILNIFNSFNDINQLKDIEVLISNTNFKKIKKDIYVKLFDKIDLKTQETEKSDNNYNLAIKYLMIALHHEMTPEDMKIVINKLNNNKELMTKTNKNVLLLFILRNLLTMLDSPSVVDLINEFIKENYEISGIQSIDGLLELSTKININKHLVLMLLLSIATKFDSYYKTYDDFIKARKQIKNNLMYIKNKLDDLKDDTDLDNMGLFTVGNFDLSYQGIPSPKIFKLRSQIFRKMCSGLNYKIDTNFTNKKIKVLFHASQLTRQHSVYKDRHQVIKNLSLDPRFEVYFSTFDELNQEVKFTFGNAKHIILSRKLSEIRNTLSKMNLDILVYCEIGMDHISYFMAHMRLARYQCNTWGHSDTSGINTIDYFFSSKLYEVDDKIDAQSHYTEKLILQNSLCTSYVNPSSRHNINNFKNRNHFGFTEENVIYFCAQSLFKFNPLFDEYLIEILTKVPKAVLVMLNSNHRHRFIQRFENKNISSRIHFFPMMQHFDFMNLMNISDIVLDIYPFGGCNSSMEAFSLNKVIVTQPSIMINGRFTRGFYLKMGLGKYICKNKKEYIDFAVKLGLDSKYRNEIESKISEKKNMLFLDKETIEEWKEDLVKIHNQEI